MLTMDGLNTVFLLLSFTSAAFAYNCVEKACYSGQCIGAETTCPVNGTNGCMINGISGLVSGNIHNCSSEPCVPAWTNITGNVFTTDCCFAEGCNGDSMPLNTEADTNVGASECYSAVCDNDGCLSEAISDKKARVCPRPENGYCMTTETGGMHATTCSPGPCVNMEIGGVNIKCCTGHLCNRPPTAPPTTNDPNVDQCYSETCFTEGCLSEAISEGTAGFCPRPPGGNCMSVTQIGTNSTLEVAGCHDGTDSSCSNMATYDFPAGQNYLTQCCKGELCNDGIRKEIPNSCYAVTCNFTGCIEEAMQNGVYAYCPQMGYGCTTTFAAGLYIASCAPQACSEFESGSIKVECCDGNLCNAPQGFTPPTVTPRTATMVRSSTGTSAAVSSSTATMVKSSTGASETEATTKKDTSGAGTLRYPRYFICFLAILLLSVVS